VCARLGGEKPLDKSTLWRRIRRDPDFPQPFYLWDSAPRFVEAEIDAYIARKIAERDDPVRATAQRERIERREQRMSAPRARARAQKAKLRPSPQPPSKNVADQQREIRELAAQRRAARKDSQP
jgi:predicted DNA-binding transcriptional regulator AlpA